MNAGNFFKYIDNPSQLYQINYQELKTLVLQYPYCQNLRYLLLQKSKMENHPDLQRNLEMAAIYSSDRTFLFNLMKEAELQPETADSYLMSEEVLELKDLTKLEEDAELLEIEPQAAEELNQFVFQPDENKPEPVFSESDFEESEEPEDYLEALLSEEAGEPTANSASDEPFVTDLDRLNKTIDEIAPPVEGDLAPTDEEMPEENIESIEDVIEIISAEKIVDEDLIGNFGRFFGSD